MFKDFSTEEPMLSAQNKKSVVTAAPHENNQNHSIDDSGDWIVIEPSQFLSSLSLKSFWEYRELFYFLALRDLKIRYKQTIIGVAWVLLQPIITTVIFTMIFLRFGQAINPEIPYPLFAFSGFTLWTFINAAILNSSFSLINHSNLITKVFFPRLIVPMSAVGATLLDFLLGFGALMIAMAIYGVGFRWEILLVFVLMIPVLALALGLGIFFAALNVKYRDVKYILPFGLQILFFSSPIFYSLDILPEDAVWVWKLNPITGILENYRALLFGQAMDFHSLSISVIISFSIFFLAVYVFHRMEDSFADVI
jgi:lipopolysaccharide transport system permease protein